MTQIAHTCVFTYGVQKCEKKNNMTTEVAVALSHTYMFSLSILVRWKQPKTYQP